METSLRTANYHAQNLNPSSSYTSARPRVVARKKEASQIKVGELSDLLAFTKGEWGILIASALVIVGFVMWQMQSIFQQKQLEEATRYIQSQNMRMENKVDEMIHQMIEFQKYDAIRSVAEQEGMTINKQNVRDLRDENR